MRRRTMTAAVLAILAAVTLGAGPVPAGEIHQAVEADALDLLKQLLARDPALAGAADDNALADLPLHCAARAGRVEAARLLLKAGAPVDGGDVDGSTPLGVAAMYRQAGMVDLLLDAGADVNLRDRNGAYALSFAISGGDSAIVLRIVDAGADLDHVPASGITLLHTASMRGMGWFVDRLLAAGADVNATTTTGLTPLHSAALGSDPVIVEALLARGAAIDARDEDGTTPLLRSCWSRDEEGRAARALVAAGAGVDLANNEGDTPLFSAAWRGKTGLAKLFLAHGADPNRVAPGGETPLIRASMEGHAELCELLLEAGADPLAVEERCGRTALHHAAVRGFGDIVEVLVKAGATLDAGDGDGATAAKLAAAHGNTKVVHALAAAGGEKVSTGCQHGEAGHAKAGCAAGKGVACNAGSLAAQKPCAEGEAVAWHLYHSGWAVLTSDHLLVFDAWRDGRQPDQPCLANGCICCEEVGDRKVVVFSSHEHGDHFDPGVLEWRGKLKDVTYVFGFQPDGVEGYEFVGPRQTREVAGCEVTTLRSNDSGVGFMVRVDGVTVFHAGDHANRQRDFSGPFKAEIDWLAAAGFRPDLAFMPISGCGFGDQEAVRLGVEYTLETLQPRVFSPMHSGNSMHRYREFVEQCGDRFPDTVLRPVGDRGDRYRYAGGQTL